MGRGHACESQGGSPKGAGGENTGSLRNPFHAPRNGKGRVLARLAVRPNTRRSYAHYLGLLKTTDTREITRLLDTMTPRVRNQALLTYKTFFKWCLRRDYLDRSPVERLQLANVSPRTRLLTDEEIRLIYRAVRHDDYGDILSLLLFTGQRRNEIASLRSEYIKDGICTLPASVTKNKREHSFPLSAFTISLLPKRSSFLFPAPRNKSGYFNAWSHGKKALDRGLGGTVAPWTLHDLRRYYASTMARLGVKQEVTERLLNHRSGIISGIAAVYTLHYFMPEMKQAIPSVTNSTCVNWLT